MKRYVIWRYRQPRTAVEATGFWQKFWWQFRLGFPAYSVRTYERHHTEKGGDPVTVAYIIENMFSAIERRVL